ncbi:MAG: endolytic transglycosylase MltG [Candidatus Sungbacteria bacterium]|uniref:Endolytic murein transglycosylase n=1 Tax=Candidatus Sungiibacteriota bacterium TaxID=2750080 RepID=A0A931WNS3_9BACT|nr:endolytic transglycosylase MltG [Candidatus Sungbacteria bacterium]
MVFLHFVFMGDEFLAEDSGLPKRSDSWLLKLKLSVLAVLATAVSAGVWLAYEIYLPHASFNGEKKVEIPAGFGSRKIGALLRDQGVIQSKWAFVTYATLKNQNSSLKPGSYVFSEDTQIVEILNNLVEGERYPNERFLTIPEGWNLRDIGFYLERNGIAQAEELWEIAGFPAADYKSARDLPRPKDFSEEFNFLKDKPVDVGLEGYLFPDTYRVFRDASVEDIVRKMLANFGRRIEADILQETKSREKTLFQVLIVASLVEEEVESDEDRATVAGILWKRLALGIPLQVDATLVYIKGESRAPLTNQDKLLPSPYNTYRYKGLPAGPIANPGLSAIRAALHPISSPYLYYLSPPNAKTIFSKTLEEHNQAKAKYLQ